MGFIEKCNLLIPRLHLISKSGEYSTALLGDQLRSAETTSESQFQHLVGRGTWFKAELEVSSYMEGQCEGLTLQGSSNFSVIQNPFLIDFSNWKFEESRKVWIWNQKDL